MKEFKIPKNIQRMLDVSPQDILDNLNGWLKAERDKINYETINGKRVPKCVSKITLDDMKREEVLLEVQIKLSQFFRGQ